MLGLFMSCFHYMIVDMVIIEMYFEFPLWSFMLRYFHAWLLGDLFEDVTAISYLFIVIAW